MTYATTDLCDANDDHVRSGKLRILSPTFKTYGGKRAFFGLITTVKVFEDNVLVRATLEEPGDGKVLFVDGGGSCQCALVGGNLAVLATKNGWTGIVVNGCIRDVDEINSCEIGVRAIAAHPLKSTKRGQGEKNVPIHIGGVRVVPGEWCYADSDGIIVSSNELARL
ncbi:hypothetical protein O6H91_14G026700 [Diphasiastrum complanatum]|uniref:Uncharacterized protein n=2 Tax=Diphasiastrum complanatum TaxID=34168 RepID=A0ACC2BMJ2_DIPCM|nr:hypothetical protein O6H91_14G026700 [Diphasiastrum complanatum]KAJ7530967.1 hypothetical protein O6H91_14G026700 [Diphasiastrum complanatum]